MATKTDNSKLEEKLIIRREVIEKIGKPKIRVLELYAGRSVMWGILRDEYQGKVEIELLSIEKERGKNPRALQGDNLKFIDGIDLSRFDIVDVERLWHPFKTTHCNQTARLQRLGNSNRYSIHVWSTTQRGTIRQWHNSRNAEEGISCFRFKGIAIHSKLHVLSWFPSDKRIL